MFHMHNQRQTRRDEDGRDARCMPITVRNCLPLMGKIARTARVVVIAAFAVTAAQNAMAKTCGRVCLDGFMDKFLASMKAHDPSLLPMTKNVKFTENTITLKPGQGLWVSLTGVTPYTFHLADPQTSQAGFLGRVLEWGKPLYIAARLKVKGGKVSEIEVIAERDAPFGNTTITTPRPDFSTPLKPSERVPRAQMIAAAMSYFDSLEQHNGKIAPFADDCQRFENGVQTTGPRAGPSLLPKPAPGALDIGALGCAAQMSTGIFIATITPRRIWLVDEERGVVMGEFFFSHDGKTTRIKLSDGSVRKERDPAPASYIAGEMFRIKSGKISRIEAVYGMKLPFGIGTGWK